MKVRLLTFMPTADELTTVQTYGNENGEAVFIGKKRGSRVTCWVIHR